MNQPCPQARFFILLFRFLYPSDLQCHLSTPRTNHPPCPSSFPIPTGPVRPVPTPTKGERHAWCAKHPARSAIRWRPQRSRHHELGRPPPLLLRWRLRRLIRCRPRFLARHERGRPLPLLLRRRQPRLISCRPRYLALLLLRSVPELLMAADALFRTMGSADLSMRIMVNPCVHL